MMNALLRKASFLVDYGQQYGIVCVLPVIKAGWLVKTATCKPMTTASDSSSFVPALRPKTFALSAEYRSVSGRGFGMHPMLDDHSCDAMVNLTGHEKEGDKVMIEIADNSGNYTTEIEGIVTAVASYVTGITEITVNPATCSEPAPAEEVATILDSSVESHLREEVRVWVENEKSDIKHLAKKGSIWENVVHYVGLAGMAPKLPVRLERGIVGRRKAYRVSHKDGTATPWRFCEEAATLYADLAAMVEAVIEPSPAEPVKVLGGERFTCLLAQELISAAVDVHRYDRAGCIKLSDEIMRKAPQIEREHADHLAKIQRLEEALSDLVKVIDSGIAPQGSLVLARAALA